jgi:hypothetical protein
VIRRLLNHGPTPHFIMVKIIRASISRLQEERVLSIWASWEEFAGDILDQLTDAGLVTHNEKGWLLNPGFVPLHHYVIIPRLGEGRGGTWIAVGTEREEKEQNAIIESAGYADRIRKILTDAGVLSPELDGHLTEILTLLRGGVSREVRSSRGMVAPPGEKNRRGYLTEPDDEPDTLVECWGKCKERKPLTREFYEVYFSKSGTGKRSGHPGLYYWRRDCRVCHMEDLKARRAERRERVRETILGLLADGEVLSAEVIAKRSGVNLHDAERDWTWLGKRYPEVPPHLVTRQEYRQSR